MTTLNFALSRTAAREWSAGDEIVVTRLDHDANISPWLEVAHDKGLVVHFCELDADELDLDHLQSLLSGAPRLSRSVDIERGRHADACLGSRRGSPATSGALAGADAVPRRARASSMSLPRTVC